MSKQTKKRNKAYHGSDAASRPHITRYSVGRENAIASWWKENKRLSLLRLLLAGFALLLGWIMYIIVY